MHRHIGKKTLLSAATLLALAAGAAQAQQSDPLYRYQWHLMNYGQAVLGDTRPTTGIDLGIDDLHDYNIRGTGVVVGVLDDGMQLDHPDLAANVIPNGSRNFFVTPERGEHDTGVNAFGVDDHGTQVTGILGAVGWNGIGVRGVAPGVKLRAFNFLVTTGFDEDGDAENDQATAANIRYAWWEGAEAQDVQVSNNSWGAVPNFKPKGFAQNDVQAFEGPMSATRGGKGIVYVKSAGNGFAASGCPQGTIDRNTGCDQAYMDPRNSLFNVMTVASVNAAGRRASYSTPGSALWISGLGGEYGWETSWIVGQGFAAERLHALFPAERFDPAIVTTDLTGCVNGANVNPSPGFLSVNSLQSDRSPLDATCNYSGLMNGTSAAAPTVSGVVALMLQANPKLTYRDVKYILATTARRVDPDQAAATAADGTVLVPGWTRNAAGYYFSNWYGYGLPDATAAVERAMSFKSLAPLVDSGWQRIDAAADAPVAIGGTAAPARLRIPIAGIGRVEAVQLGMTTSYVVADGVAPTRLSVTLVSPSGTRSVVVPAFSAIDSDGAAFDLPFAASNAFLDETGNGDWTLEVADVPLAANEASRGNFTSFKIRVLGR